MGVDRTDYLVVGWKLKKELYDDLPEDAVMCDNLIYDYMCGEYLVFGKVITSGNEPEGFDFTEIEPESLVLMNAETNKFKDLFKELTGRKLMDCVESDTVPKAMLFSHFW